MRKFSWSILVLLVVSLFFVAPEARAGGAEVMDTYFDCDGTQNGSRVVTCNNIIYTSGTLAGDFRLREWTDCSGDGYWAQWYIWTGSTWAQYYGDPVPNC